MNKKMIILLVFMNKEKQIIDLYLSKNKSMAFISRELQIPLYTVRKTLQNNNIAIRNNNCYKTKSVNEDFFEKIDTPEKAYILGFIYADGYIVNGIKGKNKDSLGITLSNEDKEHIDKFKKSIDSNHPIRIYKTKYGTNSARIIIQDEELVADLIATYGEEILTITNKIFTKLKRG